MAEEALTRRATADDLTVITRIAAWGTNPVTIVARPSRIGATVQLEIPAGGSCRVASGGLVASATNGSLLDSAVGPTVASKITTLKAISIWGVGTAIVTVVDEYTETGIAVP